MTDEPETPAIKAAREYLSFKIETPRSAIVMRSTGPEPEPEPRPAPLWMKLLLVGLFAVGLSILLYATCWDAIVSALSQ